MSLKFVFFGTPQIAADTLEILKENGYLPALIVTALDKPTGRKQIITPPPVKLWAIQNNIPVLQPEKLNEDFKLEIVPRVPRDPELVEWGNWKLGIFIVVAYGKIMPEELINLPKLGSINIHYSLLPKYRGAAPVQSAILNGEMETGVTIQKMVYKLDTGPIVAQEKVEIGPNEKTPELLEKLAKVGGDLLVKILPDYTEGKIKLHEQNHAEATFCKKIVKEDGLIQDADLCRLDTDNRGPETASLSTRLYNKFRAYYDWPRVYFFKNNKRFIITDAALENGLFIIKKVLPEGKKEIPYQDFLKQKKL